MNESQTVRTLHRVSASWSLQTETTSSDLRNNEVRARCGKRKATRSQSDTSIVPTKIFVNEKRIVSCLNRLTLDNNNLVDEPDLEDEPWYDVEIKPHKSSSEVNFRRFIDYVNSNNNSEIVLYHQLQHLGPRKAPILCDLIQDEIKKPQMQVVLWKPPGGIIKNAIENLRKDSIYNVIDEQRHPASDEFVLLTSRPFATSTCVPEEAEDVGVLAVPSKFSAMDTQDVEIEKGSSVNKICLTGQS